MRHTEILIKFPQANHTAVKMHPTSPILGVTLIGHVKVGRLPSTQSLFNTHFPIRKPVNSTRPKFLGNHLKRNFLETFSDDKYVVNILDGSPSTWLGGAWPILWSATDNP